MMTDNTTQIRATTGAQTATAPSRPARGAIATNAEVRAAADAVLRTGARPTVDNVRKHLGRGSPNRITPILADWYRESAEAGGEVMGKEEARQHVYGMTYAEWKAKFQS